MDDHGGDWGRITDAPVRREQTRWFGADNRKGPLGVSGEKGGCSPAGERVPDQKLV